MTTFKNCSSYSRHKTQNKISQTTMYIIILEILLYQIFFLPKVKHRVITSNKHGIYE